MDSTSDLELKIQIIEKHVLYTCIPTGEISVLGTGEKLPFLEKKYKWYEKRKKMLFTENSVNSVKRIFFLQKWQIFAGT